MSDDRAPDRATPAVLAALAVGALLGALGTTLATREALPDAVAAVAPAPGMSEAELQIACLPYMRQTATTLEQAQTRVSALEVRVRDKEAEIRRLEREMTGDEVASVDAATRPAEAREQLTTLEQQLATAQAEREELLLQLQEARRDIQTVDRELAASKAELLEVHEARLEDQWQGFVKDAQLEICDVGSAFAVETCRALVSAKLVPLKQRYKGCVRSAQAEPEIRLARTQDEALPDVAVWLDPKDRQLSSWYVLFCDPDLPERGQRGAPPRGTPGPIR